MAARLGVTRRGLLVGGGAGMGLLVAWALWPRHYLPNLNVAPGETMLGAFLKIGEDGRVVVVVPQVEMGQGVWTTLPQVLADELGADWRTVAVEPAPIGPLYANSLLAEEAASAEAAAPLRDAARLVAREMATRHALMITGGSSSMRGFEARFREAGALARTQLCRVAAQRWKIHPAACDTQAGFVLRNPDRLRFADLAAEAGRLDPPASAPLRSVGKGGLSGQSLPRLDLPAKIDGSVRYAGDVRLPDLAYAAVRHGPWGRTTLTDITAEGAGKVKGLLAVVNNERFAAAVATNWWAANRALDLIRPTFETTGSLPDDRLIEAALAAALKGPGVRYAARGDVSAAFTGARLLTAHYRAGFAPHAPIEPLTATARVGDGRAEIWAPTQAPGLLRDAVARTLDIAPDEVTVYPMQVGGGFGRKIEVDAAVEAAILARTVSRPVQLTWSRVEETMHAMHGAPAVAAMAATLGADNSIAGWQARIAAPSSDRELRERLHVASPLGQARTAEAAAVAGADPPYHVANLAVDHHPAEIEVPTGWWRCGAHRYTAFFTESFVDELARIAGVEPVSFRMAMLGGQARLARCLQTAASLGGWGGGQPGSNQGIACHSSFGSHVAVLAEAGLSNGRPKVTRLIAAVDCGRLVNPDVVSQQIEGSLIFGMATALGAPISYAAGLSTVRTFGELALPQLADTPEIVVHLVQSAEPPGGATDIAIPPVAPAIANALFAATGKRYRNLPFGMA